MQIIINTILVFIMFPPLTISLLIALFTSQISAADVMSLPGATQLSAKSRLGQKLFFDANLSTPPGQSCSSCHHPEHFFSDPDVDLPTSDGVLPQLKGSRNAPTIMYAAFSPPFHFDKEEGLYLGGQFLDGREATLEEQAKRPFLNPTEMANPDTTTVVEKVRQSEYASEFEQIYGAQAWSDSDLAFGFIADAIANFERSPVFSRFSSKYDYFLHGKAKLSKRELRGWKLFEDPKKGNCAACHPSRPAADGTPPLFTDFSYDNLGVPRNPDNPFYAATAINPDGMAFVDKGLGGFLLDTSEEGKFKVPTLRNIDKSTPYTHNGYFKTLPGIVDFYSSRDIKKACSEAFTSESQALEARCWPKPELSKNVNRDELGTLGLTEREIKDIVAFLRTLTDGYRPSTASLGKR